MSAPAILRNELNSRLQSARLQGIIASINDIKKLSTEANNCSPRSTRRRAAPSLKRSKAAFLSGTNRHETWRNRLYAWRDISFLANNAYRHAPLKEDEKFPEDYDRNINVDTAKLVGHIMAGNEELSKAIRQRMEAGYVWTGGFMEHRHAPKCSPFVEFGLRSEQSDILALMVSKLNRSDRRWWMCHRVAETNRLRSGWQKDYVETQPRKLFGMDMPYIVWNEDMRGVFRIDIDQDFDTIEDLRAHLQRLGCPEPNIVVGSSHGKGAINAAKAVVHPHLYWVLRDSICFTEKGRRRPKNTYTAIVDALIERLEPIGADPAASRNGLRGKNPFSPHNNTWTLATEPYRLAGVDPVTLDNLPALASLLNLDTDKSLKARIEYNQESKSNRPWHTALGIARDHIGAWKKKSAAGTIDGDMALNGFLAELENLLIDIAPENPRKPKIEWAKTVADKIGRHFWTTYKERATASTGRPRGRPRKHPVALLPKPRPGRPRKHEITQIDDKATRTPSAATLAKRETAIEEANERIIAAADVLSANRKKYPNSYTPIRDINRRDLAAMAHVSTATLAHFERIDAIEKIRKSRYEDRLLAEKAEKEARKAELRLKRLNEKQKKIHLVKKGVMVEPNRIEPQVTTNDTGVPKQNRCAADDSWPCFDHIFNLETEPDKSFVEENISMWNRKLKLRKNISISKRPINRYQIGFKHFRERQFGKH